MNIQDFFNLPEDQRELLTEMHRKQKSIRFKRQTILEEYRKLETRTFNLQNECEHPFAEKTYKANENEFGNLTGGGTYYYTCEDCGSRWYKEK